jgi:tryptophan 2,3-dioxygenase
VDLEQARDWLKLLAAEARREASKETKRRRAVQESWDEYYSDFEDYWEERDYWND